MLDTLLDVLLRVVTDPAALSLCLIGVVLGLIFGALPGVSSTMSLAVMLPVTYGMSPEYAMMLMIGVFFSSVYAGSISAILVNIPGTPGAMVTVLDGHAMTRKGRAGEAMAYALIASLFGGLFGFAFLITVAPLLSAYVLKLASPEYTAIIVLGLALVVYASSGDPLRGFVAGLCGLLLGVVGRDAVTDVPRFTFGLSELQSGIDIIPIAIGVFGIAEALSAMERTLTEPSARSLRPGRLMPRLKKLVAELPTALRGSTIGALVGCIPAAGSAIAVALAYSLEKRISQKPERFGQGTPRGIVAPEAANNACVGGALVPMMTLGIPGDSITAVLIGVLLLHGLRPGPGLFENQPEFVATIYIALLVSIILTGVVAGLIGLRLFGKVLALPRHLLFTGVLVLCLLGAYAVRNSAFDVWLAVIFGGVGYLFNRLGIPVLPLAFGVVLGPLLEENLRRTMMIHQDWTVLFARPVSLTLMLVACTVLLLPILTPLYRRLTENAMDSKP